VDGILLVDKPLGLSSFQVCHLIRKKFGVKRVGHGGTLDPEATGLLVILLGKATRLFDSLLAVEKEYEGTIVLGESRDTQDSAGEVVEKKDPAEVLRQATSDRVEEVRLSFLGEQVQEAPIHSALKHKGKPLYYYARKGIPVEPKKRTVTFYSLEIGVAEPTLLRFKAAVSKGTYLRALANDFGVRLGTLGYLGSLRRTRSGDFRIDQTRSLDDILKFSEIDLSKVLIAPPPPEGAPSVLTRPSYLAGEDR